MGLASLFKLNPSVAGAQVASSVAGEVVKGLDNLFTSEEERAAAKYKLQELMMQPQLLQSVINLAEAAHPSVFVAGWRPFIGWICAAGIAWEFIGRPMWATLFVFGAALFPGSAENLIHASNALPSLDMVQILGLTTSMLGVTIARSVEKLKGVARE